MKKLESSQSRQISSIVWREMSEGLCVARAWRADPGDKDNPPFFSASFFTDTPHLQKVRGNKRLLFAWGTAGTAGTGTDVRGWAGKKGWLAATPRDGWGGDKTRVTRRDYSRRVSVAPARLCVTYPRARGGHVSAFSRPPSPGARARALESNVERRVFGFLRASVLSPMKFIADSRFHVRVSVSTFRSDR